MKQNIKTIPNNMETFFTHWRRLACCALLVLTAFVAHAQTKFIGTTLTGPNGTSGSIFSIAPDGSNYKIEDYIPSLKYSESNPAADLVEYNGKLYGTTLKSFNDDYSPGFGAIYKYDPATSGFTIKYKFKDANNGSTPSVALTVYNGKLYGMTSAGGANNAGVIYSYDPAQTGDAGFTKLYDFDGTNVSSPTFGNALVVINDHLYGMTDRGGTAGAGCIFSYDPAKSGDGGFSKLFDFDGGDHGGTPFGGLAVFNNKLYGLTSGGGSLGSGLSFSFDPTKTGNDGFVKLIDFDGGDNGGTPYGTFGVFNNQLYGMTSGGGANGAGVIFAYDPAKTGIDGLTKLYDFTGNDDGGTPYFSRFYASNGLLYGVTGAGGSNFDGTIFSYNPTQTGAAGFKKVFDLAIFNYYTPITIFGNQLYSIYSNDPPGKGNVFSVNLSDNSVHTVIDFNEAYTIGSPGGVVSTKGKIYGETTGRVLYNYDPSTGQFKSLLTLDETTGYSPAGKPVVDKDLIYGLNSQGGSAGKGTLYSYNTVSNIYKVLVNLDESKGYGFSADFYANYSFLPNLFVDNGKIYGVTHDGGANGVGVIFSYDTTTGTYTKLFDCTAQKTARTGADLLYQNKLYGGHYDKASNTYSLFSFDVNTKTYTTEYPTTAPMSDLVVIGNKFYGTESRGFRGSQSTIFSFDLTTKEYAKLYDLDETATGFGINTRLFQFDNQIYGIFIGNLENGSAGRHTIFKFDPTTPNSFKELHDFGTVTPHLLATLGPQDLVVYTPRVTQTITFNNIPAKTYGDADFAPGATSTNATIPVTYKSDNTSVVIITTDNKIHIVGTGKVNITASQVEDDNFIAAADVVKALTVNKTPLAISAKDVVIVYGNAVPSAFEITYDKFVNGETQVVLGGNVTATTTATATSATGEYPINVTGPTTNANYAITYKPGKLIISNGTPVIAYGSNFPATLTYGAQPFDPGATSSANTPPAYTTSDASVASVTSDNKIKIVGAGSVTITATFEAGNSFNVGSLTKTITVTPAALTVTANDATRRYKTADPVFTATYAGFVNGDTEGSLSTAPQFSTTASNGSLPAVYDINACCALSPNYTFTYIKGKLTVTGNQDVTFNAPSTMTYGDAPFDPEATASSGLAPFYTTDNPSVAVVEGGKVRITGAGTANITANFPSQGDYLASNATQKLTVQPHQLTIVADNQSKVQGQPNPVLTAHFSGFVNGDTDLNLTKQPDFATTAITSSPVGTYPITASNAESFNGNYTIGYANGTLTVVVARNLTFNAPPNKTYGAADFDAGITSTTQETIQNSSSNPNVAVINNGKIHIVGAGSTTLTATLPANGSYITPTTASQLFTVNPAPLIVTANDISKIYLQPNPQLTFYYQGFVNGESSAILSAQATAATNATTSSYPGTYPIAVSGGSAQNYVLSYVSGTLTITPSTGADANSMSAKVSSRSQLDVNIYLVNQQAVNILLYDVGGRLLNNQRPALYKGFNTFPLNVGDLPTGVYIVKAVATGLNLSQKILVH